MIETLKSLSCAPRLVKLIWLACLLLATAAARADTPLLLAAFDGNVAEVERLLDAGAQVDAKAVSGSTALMVAASKGRRAVVELLIARGAGINRQNEFGWTPLMMAINQRHEGVAQWLLERGADTSPSNREGQSAFDFAVATGLTDLRSDQVPWLVARGEWLVGKRQLTTPAGNNALENFKRALALEPANAGAKAGMQAIADVYLQLAIAARSKGDVDKAASFAARGLAVVPDHVGLLKVAPQAAQVASVAEQERAAADKARVEQAQIAKARAQAQAEAKTRAEAQAQAAGLLEQAKKRAATGDLSGGIALAERGLELMPADVAISTWLSGARSELEGQRALTQRVAALLAEAVSQRKAGKLVTPQQDNAASTYRRVLELDREQADARSGLDQLATEVSERVRKLEAAGDITGALALTGSALPLLGDRNDLRALDAGLRGQSAQVATLLTRAQAQFDRGDLGAPSGDNAAESYRAVLKISPTSAAALAGLKRIAERYQQIAAKQQSEGELRAAAATIKQALQRFGESPQLLALGKEIDGQIARVDELLLQARERLAGGQLGGPKGNGAVASYRSVLQMEPGNADALQGLGKVASEYLRWIEAQKDDLQASFAIAEEGRTALPDEPRLALVYEQLQVRVKTMTALMEKAGRALTSAPQGEPSSEAVGAYKEVLALDPANASAEAALKKLHALYLDSASRHEQAGELNKSLSVLQAGLAALGSDSVLAERESQVKARLEAVHAADQQAEGARQLLAAGKLNEAMKAIESGLSTQPTHASLLGVRREIYARLAERNGRDAQVNTLLAQAKAQWSGAKPATPAIESVIGKYREVIALDPRNIDALRALNEIKDSYIAVVKAREEARDLDAAQRAVDTALVHFNSNPDLLAARERLVRLQANAQADLTRVSGMLVATRARVSKMSASILDFQTEVRVLERSAQRELETKWQPSSDR